MPSLGPFGEALGRVISPALEAAGKGVTETIGRVTKPLMEEVVHPTIGMGVESMSHGTKEYKLSELDFSDPSTIENLKDNVEQNKKSYDRYAKQVNERRKRYFELILRHKEDPDSTPVESVSARRREYIDALEHFNTYKDLTKSSRRELALKGIGNPQILPSLPDSDVTRSIDRPMLDPGKLFSPMNRKETESNLDLIISTAHQASKVVPPIVVDALHPAPRGVWHLLNGGGKETDLGINFDKLEKNKNLYKLFNTSDLQQHRGTDFEGPHNAAEMFASHYKPGDVDIYNLRPVQGGGIFSNSVGKAFLRENPDGSWDLVDDYRFYDTLEKDNPAAARPQTKDAVNSYNEQYRQNYMGARRIVKNYIARGVGTSVEKPLILLGKWAAENKQAKLSDAIHELIGKAREAKSWDPNEEGVNWTIDKMLHGKGNPYPIVVRNIDKIMARADSLRTGLPFEEQLNYTRRHWSGYRTLGDVTDVGLYDNLGWDRRRVDTTTFFPTDRHHGVKYIYPSERHLWKVLGELHETEPEAERLINRLVANLEGGNSGAIDHSDLDAAFRALPPEVRREIYSKAFRDQPNAGLDHLEEAKRILQNVPHPKSGNVYEHFKSELPHPFKSVREFHPDSETLEVELTPIERATIEAAKNSNVDINTFKNRGAIRKYFDSLTPNQKHDVLRQGVFYHPTKALKGTNNPFESVLDFHNKAVEKNPIDVVESKWASRKEAGDILAGLRAKTHAIFHPTDGHTSPDVHAYNIGKHRENYPVLSRADMTILYALVDYATNDTRTNISNSAKESLQKYYLALRDNPSSLTGDPESWLLDILKHLPDSAKEIVMQEATMPIPANPHRAMEKRINGDLVSPVSGNFHGTYNMKDLISEMVNYLDEEKPKQTSVIDF